MAKVTIRGKEFPLCLTVTALDKINEKCGGLSELTAFLNGPGDLSKAFHNTAWLLALLIEEGEKNRIVCARFDGTQVENADLPDYDTLCSLVTIRTMMRYRGTVMDAIGESMKQEIKAAPPKNVENAEQK